MATATLPSPLLDEKQAAEILNVTPGTLSVWRCTRRYPIPYVKVGRAVRYRLVDLEKFLASRTVGAAAE
ncbi:MAG: helix-turn-helix domain-containing protein [Thermoguttaceae bacterium]